MEQEADFLKRLRATFELEAVEHVRAMSAGLAALEEAAGSDAQALIVERILREAHSLKGAARSVNFGEIEALCRSLEELFSAMKRREIEPTPELLRLALRAVDAVESQVASDSGAGNAALQPSARELAGEVERAARRQPVGPIPQYPQAASETEPSPAQQVSAAEPGLADTVRIPAARIERLMLESEELLSVRLRHAHRAAELEELAAQVARWRRQGKRLLPALRALRGRSEPRGSDAAMQRSFDFVESTLEFAGVLQNEVARLARSGERDSRQLAAVVDELLEGAREALRCPLSSLFELFPKLTRELSQEQGKEVTLLMSGTSIEVDRRILQELKDPLIHLLRNCVDHGIETRRIRTERNKPARGTIKMSAEQKEGGQIQIVVSDDGAGIDAEQVRMSAVKLGLLGLDASTAMSEEELRELVFQSGVSTSPIITDISGRGLGLAIAREKVERLGGVVSLATKPGEGTVIRLLLPMTMATFRGLLIKAAGHTLAVPARFVERVMSVPQDRVWTVENWERVQVEGEAVSLVPLDLALELPRRPKSADRVRVLAVLRAEGKRIAFEIDEVVSEQELIVKGLGPQLARVRNIDGATFLATGEVVPVLNVSDLMKSAVKVATTRRIAGIEEAAGEQPKSILVVEDSITARTLLKSILEGVGYVVETAVDGVDAYTALKTGTFDLLVSDVDMPRMNGFELTAKIRADKKLADLPVVLVTALESKEDREHGIDVGANAYIIKSSFEQSNLLDAVRRLA